MRILWIGIVLLVLLIAAYAFYQIRVSSLGQHHFDAANAALERRDFSQASHHLRLCLKYWPHHPDTTFLLAQSLRRQGDFPAALDYLKAAEKLNVSSNAVEFERGLWAIEQGNFADASRLLDFSLNHPHAAETPLVIEAILKGGMKRMPQPLATVTIEGEVGQAFVKLMKSAVQRWLETAREPDDVALGLVCRGRLHLVEGKFEKAVEDLRRAVEVAPRNFQARYLYAVVIGQSSPREGADHLRILYREDPTNHRVRLTLASALRGIGELEEARKLLDAALADDPKNVPSLIERGLLARDMNKIPDAEERLRLAVTLAPNSAEAHLALSGVLRSAGKLDEARSHWDRFQRLHEQRERKSKGQ